MKSESICKSRPL